MSQGRMSEHEQARVLEAYRAAAHAEADAHFDDRALEGQRKKIMARLAHLGRSAKVIHFPVIYRADAPPTGVSRRWISVAAAAGLIMGLLGGQLVNLLPPSSRRLAPTAGSGSIAPTAGRAAFGPALAAYTPEDGFLDEVDFAVQPRTASELRALDDFTPFVEPQ